MNLDLKWLLKLTEQSCQHGSELPGPLHNLLFPWNKYVLLYFMHQSENKMQNKLYMLVVDTKFCKEHRHKRSHIIWQHWELDIIWQPQIKDSVKSYLYLFSLFISTLSKLIFWEIAMHFNILIQENLPTLKVKNYLWRNISEQS